MHRSGQIKNKRLGMKRDKRRSKAKRWGEICRKGKGTPTLRQFRESNPRGRGAAYGAESRIKY